MSYSLHAKVVRNEVSRATFKTFSIKDVCSEMGFKDILMAEVLNSTTIDCMNNKVNAAEFCHKKFKDNHLLVRAFTDKKKEEVNCQFGHNVLLTVSCDKDHLKYCSVSSFKGCRELQQYFAINHELVHHSILREKDLHHLHCYFSSKKRDEKSDDLSL